MKPSSSNSRAPRCAWPRGILFALVAAAQAAAQGFAAGQPQTHSDLDYLVDSFRRAVPAPQAGEISKHPAVFRTTYRGRLAYYIPPRCCDIPSQLYDEHGTLICYPHGGFAGGDGRCLSFVPSEAQLTPAQDNVPPGVLEGPRKQQR
jgi:hypothetical protein